MRETGSGGWPDLLMALLMALEVSPLARAVREGSWTYPILQFLHITGLTILVGSAALFDLRLLGLGRRVPVRDAAGWLLPCAWGGFGVVAITGFLLFTADATALVDNPAFRIKMGLIAVAGINAAIFHRGPFRTVDTWTPHRSAPPGAQVVAIVSLVAWTATIACGRLLAYLE